MADEALDTTPETPELSLAEQAAAFLDENRDESSDVDETVEELDTEGAEEDESSDESSSDDIEDKSDEELEAEALEAALKELEGEGKEDTLELDIPDKENLTEEQLQWIENNADNALGNIKADMEVNIDAYKAIFGDEVTPQAAAEAAITEAAALRNDPEYLANFIGQGLQGLINQNKEGMKSFVEELAAQYGLGEVPTEDGDTEFASDEAKAIADLKAEIAGLKSTFEERDTKAAEEQRIQEAYQKYQTSFDQIKSDKEFSAFNETAWAKVDDLCLNNPKYIVNGVIDVKAAAKDIKSLIDSNVSKYVAGKKAQAKTSPGASSPVSDIKQKEGIEVDDWDDIHKAAAKFLGR